MCLLLYFIFHFELYVVVNVIVGMTAFEHLITQSGLLHNLFGLLEIFGVLDLQSPSIFRFYVSVSLLKNRASNLQ